MEQLVGLAALLSAIIEVAKNFGAIPDGYAGLAAAIANVVVFAVAEIAIGFFGVDFTTIDGILMMLAQLLLMVFVSFATHKVGRAMELPVWRE